MCAQVEVLAILLDDIEVAPATESEVRAFAASHVDALDAAIAHEAERFTNLPEQRRASHVMISAGAEASPRVSAAAERRARGLLQRARAGEDFASIARAESGDSGSAASGGDLGWFERGMMIGELEEAVFAATEVGVLPELVRTSFGFHVVAVTGVRPARERASTEEARETIAPEVERHARQAASVAALFAQAEESRAETPASLADALRALGGGGEAVIVDRHGPFHADEPPQALSLDLIDLPPDALAQASALARGEVLGPISGTQFVRALERLPDAPCAPRFVVHAPPDPGDPIETDADTMRAIVHGLSWAYSDCYRQHAVEGGHPYGALRVVASLDETGTTFSVVDDALANPAIEQCVLASFERARHTRADEPTTVAVEIGFAPP